MTVLKSLLSKLRTEAASAPLPRVAWANAPALVYAIGDIHGCLDQLLALEALIAEDARGIEGEKHLVCLGDYVDRGPKSAQVIEHMLAPPLAGFGRICLRGNHEDMLLGAVTGGVGIADWLYFGGEETMQSYGMPEQQAATLRGERRQAQLQALQAYIPAEHIAFLQSLPVALEMPGVAFVHAGVRPGIVLAQQQDEDLMWIRTEFLSSDADFGAIVVHGHTPTVAPQLRPNRIGIDTGCFQTGRLTACRLAPNEPPRFLEAR